MTSVPCERISEMFERSSMEILNDFGGIDGFVKAFKTDRESGIRSLDIEERQDRYGRNVLPDPPQKSWCRLFIECFQDLMLKILLVSAVVSLILTSAFPPDGKRSFADYIDTISIFAAVLIVSVVQAQTNFSQQKAFLEINKLKNQFNVNVIRNGDESQILNTDILVGDIVCLKNGDRVPADGLYLDGHDLKIDNSQETGESVAVSINEGSPFILGGGAVESGDGKMVVCAVGPHSQSGVTMMKIQEIESEKEQSPLEKKLDRVAVIITWMGCAGAVLTFLVLLGFWIMDIVKKGWKTTMLNVLVNHFMVAVTIFICAVPEGLPLAVTLALGFSMKRMMKDNNFVRHLNACETMGGATTICSDKTGTLTTNQMTVVAMHVHGKAYGKNPVIDNPALRKLVCDGIAINTNAYATIKEGKTTPEYVGSSSECALLKILPGMDVDYKEVRQNYPVVVLHEFDSTRKRMSTIVKNGENHRIYAKGAPDFMLELCSRVMTSDGNVIDLTEDVKREFMEKIEACANESLRTMLLSYGDLDGSEIKDTWKDAIPVEQNLTVLALVGIQDPLRDEVIDAINQCRRANVVVRMVTGDFINTAKAIAKQCNILGDGDVAITGAEFSQMSKMEVLDIIPKLKVMARSSPRDKYRLVSVLMEAGEVVAVTGDGSNDSAALKKANVGLSMGLCGTELAKIASDIVILDDNFNSIVAALKWGRCIYDNVKSFLQFQLTVNFAAMIIAFIGSIALHESPLKTIQLLWVNLIMDSLGALALATRGPTDALLNRAPYGEADSLLSLVLIRNIAGQAIYQLAVLLFLLFGARSVLGINFEDTQYEQDYVSTLVFNTFVYCQVFNLINARVAGTDMKVTDGFCSNWVFHAILLGIAGLQAILTELAGQVFDTVHLTWRDWLISLGFGAFSLVVGAFLRCIPVPDRTSEKLEALRVLRRQEMRKRYQGMTAEQQWNNEYTTQSVTEGEKPKKQKSSHKSAPEDMKEELLHDT